MMCVCESLWVEVLRHDCLPFCFFCGSWVCRRRVCGRLALCKKPKSALQEFITDSNDPLLFTFLRDLINLCPAWVFYVVGSCYFMLVKEEEEKKWRKKNEPSSQFPPNSMLLLVMVKKEGSDGSL